MEREEVQTPWEECDEEVRRNGYKSYVEDVIYEFGDNAKPMTYEQWCEESKKLGEPLGWFI